jgi:hypothetical protein
MRPRISARAIAAVLLVATAAACSPVVRVEAPREPITINLNIKLDADVRVKLEEQAQKDVAKNPEIF